VAAQQQQQQGYDFFSFIRRGRGTVLSQHTLAEPKTRPDRRKTVTFSGFGSREFCKLYL
jgi:hypothetical protein